MKQSGLSRATNKKLLFRYLMNCTFRIFGKILITAACLAILISIIRSEISLLGKIIFGFYVLLLTAYCIYGCVDSGVPSYTEYRHRVASKTKNQELLSELIRRDAESYVRAEAAERIDDQQLLAETALCDHAAAVRNKAASRLYEEGPAEMLLRESTDEEVRMNCVRRVIWKAQGEKKLSPALGRALLENESAAPLINQPICPHCYNHVRHVHELRQYETCVYSSMDGDIYENTDYEFDGYICDHCAREETFDFSITVASLLPKQAV